MIAANGRNTCSVPMCKKDPKHTRFCLPKDPAIAKKWFENTGIDENTSRQVYVCEAHFIKNAVFRATDFKKRLAKGTIPTLNLPFPKPKSNINPNISQGSNYNDLVEDVIINSLKTSAPKIIRTTSIKPLDTIAVDHQEASCSYSDKRKHDKKTDDEDNIKKKQKINPKKIQTSNKNPDYAAKTIVELQKEIEDISKVPDVLNELALNIYLTYPQAYEMLHNSLRLPSVSVVKDMFRSCSISTDQNTIFARALQMKVEMMSEKQKECVVCLGQIQVQPNLHYDVKSDKLLGIVDINGVQKPERASSALVLTVQGLFADWKQPIAVSYIGTPENADISSIKQWAEEIIRNLLKIGFNVRAFVTETKYFKIRYLPYFEVRYLPYFEISNQKIYYVYDVLSLFKLFYYNLMMHDYSFDGGIAKMEHLFSFYKLDVKKELRLCPKLTAVHIKPAKLQDINVKNVKEVISLETAVAMSTYIDFGALDQSARSTVQLIKKMNTLFEILHSKSFNNSIKLASGQTIFSVLQFLRVMLPFFNNFKFINRDTKEEVPKEQGSFTENINHTIKSILMLHSDLRLINEVLPTNRLSLDNLRSFFDQVQKLVKNGTHPTCKLVNLAFMQSLLQNFLKPVNKANPVNLETALDQINNLKCNFISNRPNIANLNCKIDIRCSEYNTLNLGKNDAVVLLAGFLLKKCYDRHADCSAMKNYICIVLHGTSQICKMILDEIQKGICVAPQESFIEFVEMMEIKFRSFMTKNILETENGKLIKGLMTAMQLVNFQMPCTCFPILYAKKLFLRLRIHATVNYNHMTYTRLLTVNNL